MRTKKEPKPKKNDRCGRDGCGMQASYHIGLTGACMIVNTNCEYFIRAVPAEMAAN